MSNIDQNRKSDLLEIAFENLDGIIESWWYEIGSWDDVLENEQITMDELEWIWANIKISNIGVEYSNENSS